MKHDNRIEIRISTDLKERIAALAKDLDTDSAEILRAGAQFLDENRAIASMLIKNVTA